MLVCKLHSQYIHTYTYCPWPCPLLPTYLPCPLRNQLMGAAAIIQVRIDGGLRVVYDIFFEVDQIQSLF